MKKKYPFLIMIIIFLLILINFNKITNKCVKFISITPTSIVDDANSYSSSNSYFYLKHVDDFTPYSMQDLMNIIYTILDNGYDNFTFYCPSEYTDCINDIEKIQNEETLNIINNFVHPYNEFKDINIITSNLGEVNVIIEKNYSNEDIDKINSKLNEIYSSLFQDDTTIEDKLLLVHNYIIDNTQYDVLNECDDADKATGLLFSGKAKSTGYADTMAIILSDLGITNYKIVTTNHSWNALLLNDEWLHLDLSWDDPIVSGKAKVTDTIRHKFFLIDTETLESYKTTEHDFNKKVYFELK